MKRICLFLCCVLMLCAVGCGAEESAPTPTPSTSVVTTTASTTTTASQVDSDGDTTTVTTTVTASPITTTHSATTSVATTASKTTTTTTTAATTTTSVVREVTVTIQMCIRDRFTPKLFTTVPVGEFAGQAKYWPWFWMIVPCYVLVTPLAFLLSMIFDRKSLRDDALRLHERLYNLVKA